MLRGKDPKLALGCCYRLDSEKSFSFDRLKKISLSIQSVAIVFECIALALYLLNASNLDVSNPDVSSLGMSNPGLTDALSTRRLFGSVFGSVYTLIVLLAPTYLSLLTVQLNILIFSAIVIGTVSLCAQLIILSLIDEITSLLPRILVRPLFVLGALRAFLICAIEGSIAEFIAYIACGLVICVIALGIPLLIWNTKSLFQSSAKVANRVVNRDPSLSANKTELVGQGDIRLMLALGISLGFYSIYAFLGAGIIGIVRGIVFRNPSFPFGICLAIPAVAVALIQVVYLGGNL